MQLLRPQASIGCCGLSFSIAGLIFSGEMHIDMLRARANNNNGTKRFEVVY
jgi:hypothetical protein